MFSHEPPDVPGVTAARAKDLLAEGALLIDVREREEWDRERISGAEFKPMSRINEWYVDLPKDRTIIVQCHTGQRSAGVVRALKVQAGFDNVVNLAGGIAAWKFLNQPVER